jgi:hypothetical protein
MNKLGTAAICDYFACNFFSCSRYQITIGLFIIFSLDLNLLARLEYIRVDTSRTHIYWAGTPHQYITCSWYNALVFVSNIDVDVLSRLLLLAYVSLVSIRS